MKQTNKYSHCRQRSAAWTVVPCAPVHPPMQSHRGRASDPRRLHEPVRGHPCCPLRARARAGAPPFAARGHNTLASPALPEPPRPSTGGALPRLGTLVGRSRGG